MQNQPVQRPTGGRIKELDGFRGVAVLAIVFLHYVVHHLQVDPGTLPAYARQYLMFLWTGVDAFFVLSGFLIGGILLDQKRSANYFPVFYLRRSLRIFPPYFLLLGAWWLVQQGAPARWNLGWLMEPDFPHWPYWLYLQNLWMTAQNSIGPLFVAITWSLAIEEQFYLLFPFVVRWLPTQTLPWILLSGILLAPVFRLGAALVGNEWSIARLSLLPMRWDALLIGALVAWIVRTPVTLQWVKDRRRALWPLLLGSGGILMVYPCVSTRLGSVRTLTDAFGLNLVIAIFFGCVLLMLSLGWLPKTTTILSAPILGYFGRISYSIYLFHVAMLGLMFPLLRGSNPILGGWADLGVMVVAFAATIGLAQLTWWTFENRLIRLGHKFVFRPLLAHK